MAYQRRETILEHYLDVMEQTEAPMIFHRWSFTSCMAAALGRNVWLPFGHGRIFPNLYCMLIGVPGTRKSTSIKAAKKLLARSGYETFGADKTTKEKFLLDLEGREEEDGTQKVSTNVVLSTLFDGDVPTDPAEVFIVSDEFNEFVGPSNMEFLSMLGNFWDWDDPHKPFTHRLKLSKSVAIWQPTINLLGGNTHEGLVQAFPQEALGQGFMSRLLLIFSDPSGKKITFPTPPPEDMLEHLAGKLKHMRENFEGPMSLSHDAKGALDTIYKHWPESQDARLRSYDSRRFTQLLKLCIIHAVMNGRMEIGVHDVITANTQLAHAEHYMPQALGQFGKAKYADVMGKIATFIEAARKPVEQQELMKQFASELDKPAEDLIKIMAGLVQAGRVQWLAGKGYLPIKKMLKSADMLYVDYTLLREAAHMAVIR